MPEMSPRGPLAGLGLAAAALALLTGLGGWVAAVAGALAQPLFAIAARHWRSGAPVRVASLRRAVPPLLALWTAALAGCALVVAWPLSALLSGGSLGAVLALSGTAGIALIVLWRLWPLWQGLERDDGALGDHWRALAGLEAGAWRGLGVAVAIAAIAGLVLALAWPGWLPAGVRWALAGVLLAGSAALHGWLQRIAPADAVRFFDDAGEGVVDDVGNLVGSEDDHAPAPLPAASIETGAAVVGDDVVVDPAPTAPAAVAASAPPPEPALVYEAARSGRVERALELLDAGADPHAPPPAGDRDQRSLAALAAVLPDLRLLRALIARGVELNRAHAGITPLLAATRDSWHGRPDAVMTLLANGADPRATDADGNTPLHLAARSSDPGVAALLLDAAAELEALNHEHASPLGVACAAGNWRLARFLLERGARPEPAAGLPALLAAAAAEDDDPAGVQLLLKLKARVGARDAGGRTALHEAARAGHEAIADVLLAAGADPAMADATGLRPLHDAAAGGHFDLLERLIARLPAERHVELAEPDAQGRTLLALACLAEGAGPELLERLIALGVDPQVADNDGRRPVDHAVAAGRWALVAVLDPAHPVAAGFGERDEAAPAERAPAALLREGLAEGREHQLLAIAALLDPGRLGALLHDGDTLLPPHQIEWLLDRGADPEVRDGSGNTPVALLLDRGAVALPTLRVLLERGAAPSGAGGLARFLAGCLATDARGPEIERFALELLDRGADPFGASRAGDPPLALAVRLGWPLLLDRLLAAGANPDLRDSRGMSPLHLAAALGREAMLRRLIAQGAAPALRAADGQTALGIALSAGRRDLADWLDWRGWSLPRRPLRAADVPAAAIVGDADAVRRLLELGLPVDAADSQGCTALLRAAGGGHDAVVDLLLARGADPLQASHSGATPLSAAVSMRNLEVVDRLLDAGADIEQRLPGGLTVLMVACALGLPDLAARLLGAGADIHATDEQGRTALHCAAMFGFSAQERSRLVALLDTLLLANGEADIDATAAGATPLLLLLGARAEPGTAADEEVLLAGLEQLTDYGATIDAQDPRGFGPLHLAALHGLPQVVKWLLRAGADPELRDSLARSPREIAVMRGFVDIAAEFAPPPAAGANADISMARFLRDRR